MPADAVLAPKAALQRILVVDDDAEILRLVQDKLEGVGFEVLTAASASQALKIIERRGLPHLAIVQLSQQS